jgi:hypothetical protein
MAKRAKRPACLECRESSTGRCHRHRPNYCDICPHVDYLTVSVERHAHECSICGETFIDARREKRYFGRAPR